MTLRALQHSFPGTEISGAPRRPGARSPAGVLHLDLSQATELDASVIAHLNRAFAQAKHAGRSFRVTPPDASGPRATFLLAALSGEFGWAAGSE